MGTPNQPIGKGTSSDKGRVQLQEGKDSYDIKFCPMKAEYVYFSNLKKGVFFGVFLKIYF